MFECDKCGLCCRCVGDSLLGKELALPNGICKHFNQITNLCTIYKDRPIICNVDAYYDFYIEGVMTREMFYKLNKDVCTKIKRCALDELSR